MSTLLSAFFRFASDRSGNIAIIAALCISLLIGAVGAGVDFYYANNVQTQMQGAADAAALAASVPSLPDSKREEVARRVFAAEAGKHNIDGDFVLTLDTSAEDQITVNAAATVKNRFAHLVGFKTIGINAFSVASQAFKKPEIAFVLDVSGSMRASMNGERRLDVLKRSAKNMIDIIESHAHASNRPKYAIVPFNMNVNIGAANASYVSNTTHPLFTGTTWAGCVLERRGAGMNGDQYSASSGGPAGKWHAYIWPPEPNSTTKCTNESNGTIAGYASIVTNALGVYRAQTAGPNYNCVRHPIAPLSDNAFSIKSSIDSLTSEPNMGTIIAPGVAWGMRVLSSGEPFTEGDADKKAVRKIMVVLTDGEQTTEAEYGTRNGCNSTSNTVIPYEFDPADFGLDGDKITTYGPKDEFSPYGYILDSDPFNSRPSTWADVADDLYNVSIDACTTAKSNAGSNVEIFTIAVSADAGPGTKTYDLLKSCASDESHFFYAADAAALDASFKKIADEVVNVHLSR